MVFPLPDYCADDQVAPNIQETPRLPKTPLNTIIILERGSMAQEKVKGTLFYLHPLEAAPQSWKLSMVLRPAILEWVPGTFHKQLLANANS